MRARDWRTQKGLTLEQAAGAFGIKSKGGLSQIERGQAFPEMPVILRMNFVTQGCVGFDDHLQVWRRAHPQEFLDLRAAGRAAGRTLNRPKAKVKNGEEAKGKKESQRRLGRSGPRA